MVSQKFITQNARQTQELAKRLAGDLKGEEVLALYGQLGSGKTTFVQGLAHGLGIKKRILSPTFTLIRQYAIGHKHALHHIDLYRLEKAEEAEGLGLEEIIADKNAIVVIEWADKIKKILPTKRWEINFKYLSENKREVTVKKF
ncbi:MAG: tRNA (adenosine(37)-N6)-threonylcarbamoyltransferase complex ATPase subunit type 1 TsaE [bacterium]|nr:tRNA (adenosine(37)-N6)-threonylcarbamoyltransferase complex ATPase subunit type 1 TsaE [bacterium]